MARASAFVAGMVMGLVLGTAIVVSHADDVDAAVLEAASAAHVDPVQLAGAVNSTQTDPWTYLRGVGELPGPAPASPAPPVSAAGIWERLAVCESGGNWAARTGNGYYGGLQFDLPSWRAAGGLGLPSQASKSEQIRVAQTWLRVAGAQAWPVCSRRVGLR